MTVGYLTYRMFVQCCIFRTHPQNHKERRLCIFFYLWRSAYKKFWKWVGAYFRH